MPRINVTHIGSPWRPNPQMEYLYTLHIEGRGEPVKTYDAALASVGEHEAEEYTAKSGKTYWRIPKQLPAAPSSGKPSVTPERQFKADPDSRESIEWQVSLKAAVEVVRDFKSTATTLEDYAKDVDMVAVHFKNLINIKPKSVTVDTVEEVFGDVEVEEQEVDLPPVDQLEEPFDKHIGEL